MRNRFIVTTLIGLLFILINGMNFNFSNVNSSVIELSDQTDEITERSLAESLWPMFMGNERHTGLSDISTIDNPGRIINIFSQDFYLCKATPITDKEETIYIGDSSASIPYRAIYANGTLKWENYEINEVSTTGALSNDGMLYLNTKIGFLSIYTSNGSIKWKCQYHGKSSPVIDKDGTIYFTSTSLFAIYPNGTIKWEYPGIGSSESSPAIGEDSTIYIGSRLGKLIAIWPNGTKKWEYQTGGMIGSSPSISYDGNIYVGSQDEHLYSIDRNGDEIWNSSLSGPINNPPSIGPKGEIYVGTSNGKFFRLNHSFGNVTWRYETDDDSEISPATIGSEGTLYFGCEGYLYSLYNDGKLKWKIPFRNIRLSGAPIIIKNGDILFIGYNQVIERSTIHLIGKVPPDPLYYLGIWEHDSRIELRWKDPLNNGGDQVLKFNIYKGLESGNLDFMISVDSSIHSFNDTDVENGNEYLYHVTAVNSLGESDPSDEVSGIPFSVPSCPLNLISVAGNGFVYFDWDPPDDSGGFPIIRYDVFRGTVGIEPQWISKRDPAKTYYNDTLVEIGVEYSYCITASSEKGESKQSVNTTGIPVTVPSPPLNLTFSSGNGFVHLWWELPALNGGRNLTGFNLYRFIGDSTEPEIVGLDENTLEYNDTHVKNGIRYTYSVKSITNIGESNPGNSITAKPMGVPTRPRNLSSSSGEGYVELSWDRPENDGGSAISSYYIYRSCAYEEEELKKTVEALITRYRDETVRNGIEYSYRIRARNSIGLSAWSNPNESLPLGRPSIPRNISIESGDGFVIISWDPPRDDGGSPVMGYNVYQSGSLVGSTDYDVFVFNDMEVQNGLIYFYCVRAVNVVGESEESDILEGRPIEPLPELTTPSPPLSLSKSTYRDHIELTWKQPEEDGGSPILEYRVYRNINGSDPVMIKNVTATQKSFMDYDIEPNLDYIYFITAVNSVGESDPSEKVKVRLEIDIIIGDGEDWGNTGLYIVIASVVLVLSVIGIAFFLVNRRGKRKEEESEEDGEYKQPTYDFDSLREKGKDLPPE